MQDVDIIPFIKSISTADELPYNLPPEFPDNEQGLCFPDSWNIKDNETKVRLLISNLTSYTRGERDRERERVHHLLLESK